MVADPQDEGRQLAELALQVGRVAYGESPHTGMTPAQWTALRYFARANRFSRTVSAFAQFHATTRGTASQTIKSLVNRGYLRRTRSERDGRSARFDLTLQSRALLAQDPFEAVVSAAEGLAPESRAHTVEALRRLVEQLLREREQVLPEPCAGCGHLAAAEADPTSWRCCLMQEPLAAEELEQLCVRFAARGGLKKIAAEAAPTAGGDRG